MVRTGVRWVSKVHACSSNVIGHKCHNLENERKGIVNRHIVLVPSLGTAWLSEHRES